MKIIALAWAPFGHRLDELSSAVGGKRVNITILYGPRYFAPLRYLALFLWTLILLAVEGPDVVYAQNPPVFCPLASLLYCGLAGRRLIVDHHSVWRVKTLGGSALGRTIGFLEAFVASCSEANTAPHSAWAKELSEMGGNRVFVVHDYVEKNPYDRDQGLRSSYAGTAFVAIASHGGHPLERIETEVAAASRFEQMTLLVTGPPSKLAGRLRKLPRNVRYLGLLPIEGYLRLKASCDFALNITDEPFTLSHVLFEYSASSLPAISTKSEVVLETFGDALSYTEASDIDSVSRAIDKFLEDPRTLSEYSSRMESKFAELTAARAKEIGLLKAMVGVAVGGRGTSAGGS